jgi:hypothetical protein
MSKETKIGQTSDKTIFNQARYDLFQHVMDDIEHKEHTLNNTRISWIEIADFLQWMKYRFLYERLKDCSLILNPTEGLEDSPDIVDTTITLSFKDLGILVIYKIDRLITREITVTNTKIKTITHYQETVQSLEELKQFIRDYSEVPVKSN